MGDGSSRSPTAATSSCCAPRRARPTSSGRPWTAPASPDVLGTRGRRRHPAPRLLREGRRRHASPRELAGPRRPLISRHHEPPDPDAASSSPTPAGSTRPSPSTGCAPSGTSRSSRSPSTSASGPTTWDTIRERALAAGAVEALVVDARAEFAEQYCLPRSAGQRALRGQVPARVGAVASRHRQAPRRRRPRLRRRRRRPRLHREGQRPGPLRGLAPRPRARPRRPRARARAGGSPARTPSTTRPATTSRSRSAGTTRTRSTRTSGAAPSSAAPSRTRGPRRPPSPTP